VQRVDRRYGEVAALDARAVPDVAVLEGVLGYPGRLLGVDRIAGAGHVGMPLDVVKDEELGLRSEERRVTDARGLEVLLGAQGHGARIALVALHRGRLDDVAAQDHGRVVGERVQHRGAVIGHEDHVRLVDALPAGDGGAVEHLAAVEEVLVDLARGNGDVLFLAAAVGEAQVYPARFAFLDQVQSLL
jgi:hypothetical protein